MTYRQDFTVPAELMEQVQERGLEILPELIGFVINAAMQAERSEYLQAEPYQHTPEWICQRVQAQDGADASGCPTNYQ